MSLVEALLAVVVLALVAISLYGAMVQSVRTTGLDRAHEARRQVLHDLLERYAHDGADVASLWPAGASPPYIRTLTVDEALAATGCTGAALAATKASLASGLVSGFTLAWSPGVRSGPGAIQRAVRLDRLHCATELAPEAVGPAVVGVRLFVSRSRP